MAEPLHPCAGNAGLAVEPRFETNPERVANRMELDRLIKQAFAPFDRETVIERLDAAGIAYGRLSTLDDLEAHPQNRYLLVETPAGPVELLAPGAAVTDEDLAVGPVPGLDEHGPVIRAEFAL
ncbi:MAG: CoA transferase [Geminicoccaceae bacterium]